MTEDQLRDELDKWERVQYRMSEEGIEYCFRHYSSFSDIKDEGFHSKRRKLLNLMVEMEQYVADKMTEVEDKIIELEG
jgi:predicted ABC-type exoprotein transport system permease subunit